MNENAKKFLEALKADKDLENELEQALKGVAQEEQTAAVVKFAQEKGFELSEEDLIPDGQEISLDELDNVAAAGGCGCVVVGGGGGTDSNDGKTYGCACVIYGQGGDGNASDANCLCGDMGVGGDDMQCLE